MNKIVIGLLLVSGFAIAQDQVSAPALTPAQFQASQEAQPSQEAQGSENLQRMSLWTKIALNTQSPRIHTAKIKNDQVVREGDRIVSDKTTINAYVPWGR